MQKIAEKLVEKHWEKRIIEICQIVIESEFNNIIFELQQAVNDKGIFVKLAKEKVTNRVKEIIYPILNANYDLILMNLKSFGENPTADIYKDLIKAFNEYMNWVISDSIDFFVKKSYVLNLMISKENNKCLKKYL